MYGRETKRENDGEMERDIFREKQNEGDIDRDEDINCIRESSRRRRKEEGGGRREESGEEREGRSEEGRRGRGMRGRGMSVPDARVEVVWLKSRHAMGPS